MLAVATAKKSEVPDLADSKPSFGDKQKPLYHTPLKWRKLVGKPQVRRKAEPWLGARAVVARDSLRRARLGDCFENSSAGHESRPWLEELLRATCSDISEIVSTEKHLFFASARMTSSLLLPDLRHPTPLALPAPSLMFFNAFAFFAAFAAVSHTADTFVKSSQLENSSRKITSWPWGSCAS